MRTEPFGVDTSSHNGSLNKAKVLAHCPQIQFAFTRSGMSWGWEDPTYKQFTTFFESLSIPCWPYHVLFPGEDPKRQANRMLEICGGDHYYYAIDEELIHGRTKSQISEATRICAYELMDKGKRAVIYTSPLWYNEWAVPNQSQPPLWHKNVLWWLAQYLTSGLEHPGLNELVKGMTMSQVIAHQSSSQYDGYQLGQPSGSPKIDINRWMAGAIPGVVVIPEPITIEQRVKSLEDRVTVLENS